MTMWCPDLTDDREPRYLALLRALERDIGSGHLPPGARLPTHRKLALALGISVGTVTRAYAEAEARGLLRGEVGRGTFVGGRATGGGFPTGGGAPTGFDLAVTWPLHALDPDLAGSLRRVAARSDVQALLRYPAHGGFPHHREAGSAWAARYGIPAGAERVLVCAGVQHALLVTLSTLAVPGSVVLTESFTYPGIKALAESMHLRLAGVPMDGEGILPDAFEAACRLRRPKALYTVPTIQNPTAAVLAADRRLEIARLAELHGVAIVEDDVHRLLHPNPPPAFAALAPELTYSIASLSKVVAGGLRVAFLVAPRQSVERLSRAIWATAWVTAPLPAEIATLWIDEGTAWDTVLRKRAEAAARQRLARESLRTFEFRTAPNAYHVWLELPEPWHPAELALAALREGVHVTPASAFAVGEEAGRAVRLSLSGAETREELVEGLERLRRVLVEGRQTAVTI